MGTLGRRWRRSQAFLLLLWGAAIVLGLYSLARYSFNPAAVTPAVRQWPPNTGLARPTDRPTLLVAIHPRCSCSHATLEELARLVAETPSPLQVQILVYRPDAAAASWAEGALTKQARSIPGAVLHNDPAGLESQLFGLSTSGQTSLYSPGGGLLFSGGITPARGHRGDNAGSDAILSILLKHPPAASRTPVFGCSILGRDKA